MDSKNQNWIEATVAASTRVGQGPSTEPLRVFLVNKIAAKIISWGRSISIHRLEDATFPCSVIGDPHPTVRWDKTGIEIKNDNGRLKAYPDGSLVIRNAQAEDSGNYSCTAQNIHGKDFVTYTFLVQMPPSAPVVEVKSAMKNSMIVTWKAKSDGGASLLRVILSFKEDFGGWNEVTVPPSENSYTLSNLACGRNYQVFATAVNKVGEGTPSAIISARTAGAPPIVDQRVSPISSNDTWISVNFIGWRDGGCPISHYGVAYRALGDSAWLIVSEQIKPNEAYVEIGGLKPQSSYVVRVTAHNSAGVTSHDYALMTTTRNGELPPPEFVLSAFPSFLKDLRVILPLVASLLALVSACVTVSLCLKRRPNPTSTVSEASYAGTDSFTSSEKQKEHFYATIKRVSPPYKDQGEVEDDTYDKKIHQYSTFQMTKTPGLLYPLQKEKNSKEVLPNCKLHKQDAPNHKRIKSTDDRVNCQQRYRQQMPIPNANYCSFAKFQHRRQSLIRKGRKHIVDVCIKD
ncbi:Down syndrome cell adhesion molecule-like protein Dscam2 [Armadillidium nasatum]|uniref:Down syndrome cell adhesion molecule-like protein Dscam2 n=1 Tax=Armadillidium nasatum TaxID=96803 RepID=A0A5N5SKR3_9CRUS|nr:Down syndrome cell adhesion molecule-like protein Dscam2 [Armadillidium nasatum]